jgi:AraC-like DNA-binding protein
MTAALIRTNALYGWDAILATKGLESASYLGALNSARTRTPCGREAVHLRAFVEFLERVAEATDASTAWGAGSGLDYATRGKVGQAILSSRTLGIALRRLTDYFPLLQDATDLSMSTSDNWTTLSYRIVDPDIWPRHHDAMYSLGIYASLLRAAAPDAWCQAELTVEAPREQVVGDLSHVVKANCVYGGDTNALRFPTRALDCRLELAPASSQALTAELSQRLVRKRRETPIMDRVRYIIFRDIGQGNISQEHVSAELGMTSRTLRRRLVEADTSYQAILDDCRMRAAAKEFRVHADVPIAEVALKLGYSEHSTFTRAFARLAGMAPLDYRRAFQLN